MFEACEFFFSIWEPFEVIRKIPVFMEEHHSLWKACVSKIIADDDEIYIT